MKKDWGFYGVIAIVVLVSAILSTLSIFSDDIKLILSLPAISGLTSIIVQAWRDQRAHERALELQLGQNQFTLGIASEMARLAFSKHVEFAETYAERVNGIITELFRDGPTKKAIGYFQELRELRKKYTVWLSRDIDSKHCLLKKLF